MCLLYTGLQLYVINIQVFNNYVLCIQVFINYGYVISFYRYLEIMSLILSNDAFCTQVFSFMSLISKSLPTTVCPLHPGLQQLCPLNAVFFNYVFASKSLSTMSFASKVFNNFVICMQVFRFSVIMSFTSRIFYHRYPTIVTLASLVSISNYRDPCIPGIHIQLS